MKTSVWRFFGVLLTVSFVSGCTGSRIEVSVSAASSLTEAMTEVNRLYVQQNPNVNVALNFAGSGVLQKQIENGAPVDVFISASPVQMDALQKANLIIDDTRKNLLINKVVLITPFDSALEINSFKDLNSVNVKMIAIGDARSVPAGMYAQKIFDQIGITEEIRPRLILAGDVRQVLTYVESGNVDAGVVFLTDANISEKVRIVAYAPDGINSLVVYPVAVIRGSRNANTARDYENFLSGDRAKEIFRKYGFSMASK